MVCLVWLEWPERCFRAGADSLRELRKLLPPDAKVVRARSEREFLRRLPAATHAIVWHFRQEWYALAPNLKVLATPGAGRELVSADAPPGVQVHFGSFHGEIMAETVAGFMLAWARGFFRPELRLDGWRRTELSDKCHTVAGTHAVIAGYGRIGKAIGAKLEALGVRVSGFGRSNLHSLPSALRTADWLVMALPSDTGTDDFLDAKMIRRLPRRCVVANVGRGNSVDEAALVAALESGRIAGAYLDVFKGEPGPLRQIVGKRGGSGILDADPRKLPWNLIRTPHSSAFSASYLIRAFRELKDDGQL